jgi:hypothetical protein
VIRTTPVVTWKKYSDYSKAANVQSCLYVFKKGHIYLYIGKAKQFGGASGRYAHGYRYLVDALLKSGAKLYIAKLGANQWLSVRDYENTLLNTPKGLKAVNRSRPKNFNWIHGLNRP